MFFPTALPCLHLQRQEAKRAEEEARAAKRALAEAAYAAAVKRKEAVMAAVQQVGALRAVVLFGGHRGSTNGVLDGRHAQSAVPGSRTARDTGRAHLLRWLSLVCPSPPFELCSWSCPTTRWTP